MRPYYAKDGIVIYNADCREVIPTLAPESIGVVLTDPPYNVGKHYGEMTDDNKPEADYWADYAETFGSVWPAMKLDTYLYVSSTTNQMYHVRPLMEALGWLSLIHI